ASSTSCLRMRPPTPVPVSVLRSTPCSAASLRTSGVTYGVSPVVGSGVGCGAGACGAGAGAGGGGGGACVYAGCGAGGAGGAGGGEGGAGGCSATGCG